MPFCRADVVLSIKGLLQLELLPLCEGRSFPWFHLEAEVCVTKMLINLGPDRASESRVWGKQLLGSGSDLVMVSKGE